MPMQVESERLKQKETKKVKVSLPYRLLGSKKFILGIFYWRNRNSYNFVGIRRTQLTVLSSVDIIIID